MDNILKFAVWLGSRIRKGWTRTVSVLTYKRRVDSEQTGSNLQGMYSYNTRNSRVQKFLQMKRMKNEVSKKTRMNDMLGVDELNNLIENEVHPQPGNIPVTDEDDILNDPANMLQMRDCWRDEMYELPSYSQGQMNKLGEVQDDQIPGTSRDLSYSVPLDKSINVLVPPKHALATTTMTSRDDIAEWNSGSDYFTRIEKIAPKTQHDIYLPSPTDEVNLVKVAETLDEIMMESVVQVDAMPQNIMFNSDTTEYDENNPGGLTQEIDNA